MMIAKTNNERQQARRERERQWLKAHNLTSWEALHTALMNGTIALDRTTPAYSKPSNIDQAVAKLQPEVTQLADALTKKKGRQS